MTVGLDRDGGVAVLTIQRPEALNALDRPTLEELYRRLGEAAAAADVRVVVLTGAGERAFAAGADIKYMQGLDPLEARRWGELGHGCGRLLETMAKPTIAAIDGFALGGGCELALACDLRYASSRAKLGQPEINLAIIPGWGGTQRLARTAGLGFAKELILTGRIVDADEARKRGLVTDVFAPEELLAKTIEIARGLAAKSPLALAAAKETANRALQGGHAENLAHETALFALLFSSDEQKEGMAAFVEKREPRFPGR
ncbi:MAG: enoyl-CoA hydratase-related protein [Actinomycetota bacterium]|nr:enoyl-CoA hydratase-related protein [Actinomycetota bacterium]